MTPETALDRGAAIVRDRLLRGDERPALGVVLGSGWDALAAALGTGAGVGYAELPGFPEAGVPGHAGRLEVARPEGTAVLVFRGRFHLHEGHDVLAVTRPVDLLDRLGCGAALLTCAAGAVREDLAPGDLVLVADHLNLSGEDPARGAALPGRFPDRSAVYDPTLRERARSLAARAGVPLAEGVLAALRGPGFETPAEVRALRALGADLASMSTVPEALRASDLGLRVLALALVANRAAGVSAEPLRHEDVVAVVSAAVASRAAFLRALVTELARP